MSVICKILVYTNDANFSDKMKRVFGSEEYVLRVVGLFTEVVEILHFELYDVLVIETEFMGEMNGLLKIADNVLLGIPIVVACGESKLKIVDGENSRFYFVSKFADPEEWEKVIQMAVSENYIITTKGAQT